MGKNKIINRSIINEIKAEAKKYFIGASGCHDWTHVERVRNLALRISKKEKADLAIVEIAALFHDIGRKKEMQSKGRYCHAEEGGKIVRKILEKYDLRGDIINQIVHCIETHRFRKNNKPKTIEAKVLFDADKLDSIGAVGIGRAFLFAGSAGSKNLYTGNEKELARRKKDFSYTNEDSALLEYEIKLKHIKDRVLTKEGKKIFGMRKCTAEPVFGIIKEAMGFRQFLLRGMENVFREWSLVCTSYNLKRMFNMFLRANLCVSRL